MKIKSLVSMVMLVTSLLIPSVLATVVGTSTIEQPVNLGTNSDPTRIPLGSVGVICNHGYGLHHFIGEARPAPDGAMHWPGGSELDQNLASAFGISVEPEDSTQINAFPVILRVKSWKPPGYTPYTKEQVLAATLWCLVRSAGGTPENPLDVRVVAEGEDDKVLEAKYSGKYVTRRAKEGEVIPPLNIPGTLLEEDARGIAWVVFPDVKKNDAFIPVPPSAIILKSGGDGDTGWHVLPVWGNSADEGDFLRLNHWSSNICYSAFKPHGVGEANTYLAEGGTNSYSYESGRINLQYPRVDQTTLAANILALVISKQPTEAEPLTISFLVEDSSLAEFPAFRQAPGWTETRVDNLYSTRMELACEFAWDPVGKKLAKGSIPLVQFINSRWIAPNAETTTPAGDIEKKIAADVADQIRSGIRNGSLLAEKNIPPTALHDSGLLREIGIAGYYEALATYANQEFLPAKPQTNPVKFIEDQLRQSHEAGWVRGLAKGQEIAIEARKAVEAKEKKAEE